MNNQLYDLLIKAQKRDDESLLIIIARFKPLIKKYSRRFKYDDISTELIIAVINAVYCIPRNIEKDKDIASYIGKCVINKYNRLMKEYINTYNMETELNLDLIGENQDNNIEERIILHNLLDELPYLQRKVIFEEFFEDFSEAEIAKKLNVSRQAVNRTKNRALKNLRLHMNC